MDATLLQQPETLEGTVYGECLDVLDKTIAAFKTESPILTGEDLIHRQNSLRMLHMQVEPLAPTNLTSAAYRLSGRTNGLADLVGDDAPWSWRGEFNGAEVNKSLCYHVGDSQTKEVTVRMTHEINNPTWKAGRSQLTNKHATTKEDGTALQFLRNETYETPGNPPVIEYWLDQVHGGDVVRAFIRLVSTSVGYRPTKIEYISYGHSKRHGTIDLDKINPEVEDEFINEVASRLCPTLPVNTN